MHEGLPFCHDCSLKLTSVLFQKLVFTSELRGKKMPHTDLKSIKLFASPLSRSPCSQTEDSELSYE